MEINRRPLYNSLRMNWIIDPTLEVEPWQVEDYRSLPLDEIFERLEDHDIHLDKFSFIAFAENLDSPEEMTDGLLEDLPDDVETQDQVYLLIFELWRRLIPEKTCLSVFCDELDHQIHLYDRGQSNNVEAIQDVIANLQVILDENIDEGVDPHEALDCIDAGCANDVESFLYDFIAEQIDNDNLPYAIELLEGFSHYVRDVKWFEFLRARVLSATDPKEANQIVRRLVLQESTSKKPNLEFNLELLSFLVRVGDKETFDRLVKSSANLIEAEEDFQDLVSISADFYHCLDRDPIETQLQEILKTRTKIPLEKKFDRKDPQFAEFFKIIS